MDNRMKNTLVQLPSGTIDLVIRKEKDAASLFLQFNTTCAEALPYCGAMCCRMQSVYSAIMTEKEGLEFGFRTLTEQAGDKLIMPTKASPLLNECKHLTSENLCSVDNIKPATCRNWHCSPEGKGDGIITHAQGWLLLPTQT